MREFRIGGAGIVVALGFGVLATAVATPAAAQPWGRYWGGYYYYGPGYYRPGYYAYGPRVYEEEPDEPPPGLPDGAPDQAAPSRQRAPVPLARIEQQVAAAGLRLVAKPRHNGRIYLAVGEDRRGQRHRLVFDAYGGNLIQNTVIPNAKPGSRGEVAPAKPLPSEATKSPLEPTTKMPPPPPPPAEAKAKLTDPLAIPKEADAAKPPPPPQPAAGDAK